MTTTPSAVPPAGSTHLSDPSLVRLRDRLATQCADEAAHIAAHRLAMSELTGQLDGDSLVEREIAEAAIERSNGVVIEIFCALVRLDDGTYGVCEQCSMPIPSERLEAIPYARLCVSCLGNHSTRTPGAYSA